MGIPTCIASNILLSWGRESFGELMDLVLDGRGGQREGFVEGRGNHCETGGSRRCSIYTDLAVEKENGDGHACLSSLRVQSESSLAFTLSVPHA
jgi:hypothetical protein